MKLLKVLLVITILISPIYAQWNMHSYKLENIGFQNIFFKSNNGWIIGSDGIILFSSDGGENWQQQSSQTDNQLNSVYFINENFGWVVGDSGTYLKTKDAGSTWEKQIIAFNNDFYRVQFVDTTIGFISGKDVVIKTTNGGNTWFSIIDKPNYFYGMHWLNENIGFIGIDTLIGFYRTVIQKTTNGGLNWSLNSIDEFPYFTIIYEIKFKENIGNAIGEDFLLWKTTNFGDTWNLQTQPFSSNYYAIDFITDQDLWIAGRNSIRFSSDGGESWIEQLPIGNLNFEYTIRSIQFLDSLNGFAVGRAYNDSTNWGLILRTNNGGGITAVTDENIELIDYLIVSCYPNPFNSATTIKIQLPQNELISLEVFNLLGQKIETIFYGYLVKGTHNFYFQNNKISSGLYILRYSSYDSLKTLKLLLIE